MGVISLALFLISAYSVDAAFRLPSTITPTKYSLSIAPSLEAPFTYTGRVNIIIQTSNVPVGSLNTIALHKDFSVTAETPEVTAVASGQKITVTGVSHDNETQMYTLTLASALSPNSAYNISIAFSGVLRKDYIGLFVGSYTFNSTKLYYVAANFKPMYARLAFPCFDEPGFKSVFELTVKRTSSQLALSNMPASSTSPDAVVFTPSPKISTHSLSIFVASNASFTNQTQEVETGTNLTIFYPIGTNVENFSTFLLLQSIGEQVIQVSHPLKQCNIFVLPDLQTQSFAGLGNIYFRQDLMMRPYQGNTEQQQIETCGIFLDQIVRQFVSDFVTPAWWSDVWLTEGIATYFKYIVLNYALPLEVNVNYMLMINTRQAALSMDTSSYPLVEVDINTTTRIIRSVQDDLKKYKGAAVLMMVDTTFSGAASKAIITKLLVDKAYGTMTTAEFLQLISEVNNEFTGMEAWFSNSGYPVVAETGWLWNGSRVNVLSQTPASWKVPITFTFTSRAAVDWVKTTPSYWITDQALTFLSKANSAEWFIFNLKASGFYRFLYNTSNLNLIKDQLKSSIMNIDEVSHATIVDDVISLALSSAMNYSTALSFLQDTSQHERFPVWVSTIGVLQRLKIGLYGTPAYTLYQDYVRRMLNHIYGFVGHESKSTDTLSLDFMRNLILPWACEFQVGDCMNVAREMNKYIWYESSSNTSYNYAQLLCAAFRSYNETQFQEIFTFYKKNHLQNDLQYYIAFAMGCVTDQTNVDNVLKALLNGEIYDEDVETVFTNIGNMQENVDAVLNVIVKNTSVIREKYGSQFLMKLVSQIASHLYTQDQVNKLATLLDLTTDPLIASAALTIVPRESLRVARALEDVEALTAALKSEEPASNSVRTTQSVFIIVSTLAAVIFLQRNTLLCN